MAQFSKVKILKVETDKAQVYKDNKAVEGEFTTRVRALVVPIKPDPLYVNITKSGDEVINTFKALEGKTVLFPARLGVTDSGVSFLSLENGITIDDIDIIPDKAPKPLSGMGQPQQKPATA